MSYPMIFSHVIVVQQSIVGELRHKNTVGKFGGRKKEREFLQTRTRTFELVAMSKIIRYGAAFCALSAVLLLSVVSRVSALSVTVSDVECLYEYVFYEGDTVSGNFVVEDYHWNSDPPGVDFTVTSPGGSVVHDLKGSSGDKFEFKATKLGMYKFCFHNTHSTPETVSFNIHTGHIPTEHDLAKDEHLDPVNVKIAELREALESVTLEQKYLRARDARHRHTNESTRRRVIYYTVAEYLLLAAVSGLQVFYIRRLFSKSVAYGRV